MPLFKVVFEGRLSGAIGNMDFFVDAVEAETLDEAREGLYIGKALSGRKYDSLVQFAGRKLSEEAAKIIRAQYGATS